MAKSVTSPHVLVINHSPDVLDLMEELLTDEGYRVTTRSHLDRNLDEVVSIDPSLILIDYMWASTDDDWSLLQLIRLHPALKEVPLILCTAAVREVRSLESHLHDMDVRVILKPFDVDEILAGVAAALAMSDSPQQ